MAICCGAIAGLNLFSPAAAESPVDDDPASHCRTLAPDKSAQIACLEAIIAEFTATRAASAQTAAAQSDPRAGQAKGFGAEQLEERQRDGRRKEHRAREEVLAAVVEFARTPAGTYVFFLDNGQVWRQKPADLNQIRLSPKQNYTVVVSKGMLSGYRLTVAELRRTLLVERIK